MKGIPAPHLRLVAHRGSITCISISCRICRLPNAGHGLPIGTVVALVMAVRILVHLLTYRRTERSSDTKVTSSRDLKHSLRATSFALSLLNTGGNDWNVNYACVDINPNTKAVVSSDLLEHLEPSRSLMTQIRSRPAIDGAKENPNPDTQSRGDACRSAANCVSGKGTVELGHGRAFGTQPRDSL
jgi:hypothetical protein